MPLWQLLFTFNGRINRARYWIGVGILFLVGTAAMILELILNRAGHPVAGSILSGVVSLATIGPSFAITIKRLHDRDMSGWWMLISLAPFPLLLLGVVADIHAVIVIGLLLVVGLYIWLFVQTGCLRGTVGPNRFGPDPLDTSASLSLNAAE